MKLLLSFFSLVILTCSFSFPSQAQVIYTGPKVKKVYRAHHPVQMKRKSRRSRGYVINTKNYWTYSQPFYYWMGAGRTKTFWQWASFGDVPVNAIRDRHYHGAHVYHCRVSHGQYLYEGRLFPGKGCYFDYHGKTIGSKHYRVLVR